MRKIIGKLLKWLEGSESVKLTGMTVLAEQSWYAQIAEEMAVLRVMTTWRWPKRYFSDHPWNSQDWIRHERLQKTLLFL